MAFLNIETLSRAKGEGFYILLFYPSHCKVLDLTFDSKKKGEGGCLALLVLLKSVFDLLFNLIQKVYQIALLGDNLDCQVLLEL